MYSFLILSSGFSQFCSALITFNPTSSALPLRHIFQPIILTCVNTNGSNNSSLIFLNLSIVFVPNALWSPLAGLLASVSPEGESLYFHPRFTVCNAQPGPPFPYRLAKTLNRNPENGPFRSARAAEKKPKKKKTSRSSTSSAIVGNWLETEVGARKLGRRE